ncbi:MAG: arsenite methyltransferase [Planctomycetota bacterium]|jgi:SAM-dependent methyltransferase
MSESRQVREKVSKAYARAVCAPSPRGSPCCGPAQKGEVVKLAGYTRDELESLPPEAVVNFFGCGNPLALGEVKEGDVVLDLGSGAGIDILLAAKKVGPTGRAIGIDMTDEMIAKAQENIANSELENAEIRKGIIEDLPVESGSVDWVISNCVINLSPEKPKVFAEIARVLKPGGRMLVSDIVVTDLPDSIRKDQALYNSCVAGAISEEEYIDGLRRAGLSDVEVRERIVYDATQLRAFTRSEFEDLADSASPTSGQEACCCGPATATASATNDIVESLVGKIWSAKFFARKPGA